MTGQAAVKPYRKMIDGDSRAEDVWLQSDEVRQERVDKDSSFILVNVQTVALQQGSLIMPTVRPVLSQLLHLQTKHK